MTSSSGETLRANLLLSQVITHKYTLLHARLAQIHHDDDHEGRNVTRRAISLTKVVTADRVAKFRLRVSLVNAGAAGMSRDRAIESLEIEISG